MTDDTRRAGGANLFALFRTQARARPEATAVEQDGRRLAYAELLDRAARLASVLRSRGVRPGDRVAILSRNRIEYLEAELACAAAGAILACQNWRLAEAELRHCLELVSPRLTLVEPGLRPALDAARPGETLEIGPDWEAALAAAEPAEAAEVDPEDGLVILYTSGTTGLPKAAVISHRAMIARGMAFAAELGLDPEDGFVAWAPMFHMVSTDHALATLLRGGAVTVVDGYQPGPILDALAARPIGWLVLIPGMIEDFCAALSAHDAPRHAPRVCGAMADLVPPRQLAEVTRRLGCPYLNSFGATETGLPPATRARIPAGEAPENLAKRASAFCEFRLTDAEGREVPDGEPGEMTLRGPTLFSGYWNDPEATAKDFAGGWFRMGDMFRRNPDGSLDFVDRAKYLIKTGGENVYPAEIERVLMADPEVTDAAVVRAPDPRWGETPVAFVSRAAETATEQSLMARCREALAGYKRPREIRFIAFGDFPRSTSGKIQRHVLEARLAEADRAAG